MNSIGFIGSGNMAFALAKSFSKTKLVSSIIMSDKNDDRLDLMKENSFEVTKNNKLILSSEIVFICVKPQDIEKVIKEIKPLVKDQIIVSVAAGITINQIEKIIPKARLFRVMPNLLCEVNEMSSVYCYNQNCDFQDENIIDALLNNVGVSFKVNEKQIDVVTALSGSSPAYFAYFIKYFIDASIKNGLNEDEAKKLIYNVVIGTGKYLRDNEINPEDLINLVMSPKGVTYMGIEELRKKKVDDILKKVFDISVKKSKDLGKNGKSAK
jgi:pyrroline-5-carboxylate reductase